MIREKNLDIRSATMGISLFDCILDYLLVLRRKHTIRLQNTARIWSRFVVSLRHTDSKQKNPISYVALGLSRDCFSGLKNAWKSSARAWRRLRRRMLGTCAEGRTYWGEKPNKINASGALWDRNCMLFYQRCNGENGHECRWCARGGWSHRTDGLSRSWEGFYRLRKACRFFELIPSWREPCAELTNLTPL